MNVTHLGLLAGAITTVSGIPQVVKSYRSRHVRDISVWQPLLLNIGMVLWLIYGILLHDLPLIVANSISIVCYTLLLIMKFAYRENDAIQAEGDRTLATCYEEES